MTIDLPPLSPVDIAALTALLAGVIQGYRGKLSGELARLFSLLTAFVLGLYACRPFGQWLVEHTRIQEATARGVAFVSILAAAIGVIFLIRFVLGKIMRVIFEPTTDLVGGCIAGFLRAMVMTIVVFLCMNMWQHDYLNRKFGEESVFGTLVIRWTPFIEDILARLSGKDGAPAKTDCALLVPERPAAIDVPAKQDTQEPPAKPEKKKAPAKSSKKGN